jgi:hypothetical protein
VEIVETGLISAMIGAQVGSLQLAVAARLMRMNTGDNSVSASAAKLVDAAQQSIDNLANVAAGVGTNLDISA